MAISDRGLGSPNMSDNKKKAIQSAGGKASGTSSKSTSTSTNKSNFANDRKRASDEGRIGGSH